MTELAHPPEIRKARVEDAWAIAEIHVASWQATYPGLLPQEVLDTLSVERRADMWRGILQRVEPRAQTRVVEVNGEMAGFVNAGPTRSPHLPFDGELVALYLSPRFQQTGIGRALCLEAQRDLSNAGFSSMLVWVLEGNPACRFYEKMGGIRLETVKMETIGTEDVVEVAYGWSTLP